MVATSTPRHFYLQVVVAVMLGIVLGHFVPETGQAMKPLGDAFIKLIKMLVAPIIFCTVVTGIAGVQSLEGESVGKTGRIGLKALLYFEVVSTAALLIGLLVVHVVRPGEGMGIDATGLDASVVAAYTKQIAHYHAADFLLNIIPATVLGAFAEGDILQVLLFSLLFGFSLSAMRDSGREVAMFIGKVGTAFFGIVETVMKLAPIGAFGAMAFTIGKYGLSSLLPMAKLMACFYLTCLLFIFVVLRTVANYAGFSIAKLLGYIKEELVIVLGTSSSESVLPRIMLKLEALGCQKSIVGLVIPTGYSFNLDGTSIYLAMAAIFIAQATDTPLTFSQEVTLFAVLLLTSKGAAGVTGSGFVTLAATLSAIPGIPVAGLALILGIDRFMSEARALTNLIGNCVATIVVANWEQGLDRRQLEQELGLSKSRR